MSLLWMAFLLNSMWKKDLLLPIELEQTEDKYFENIIDTYQFEDTPYAVPTGFWLYTLQGPTNLTPATNSSEDLCQWILSNSGKAGFGRGMNTVTGIIRIHSMHNFIYDTYSDHIISDGSV